MADVMKNSHATVLSFAAALNGVSIERIAQKTGIGESRLRNLVAGVGDNWTSPGEANALQRVFGATEKELLAPGTPDNCFAFLRKV
jgi:hypothetical protein